MRRSSGQRLAGAALLLALAAVALLVFVPVSSTESVQIEIDPVSGEQQEVRRSGSQTLLEHEGASVLAVLAVPVVLAGLGVIGARRSARRLLTAVAVAYAIGVFLALASIGLFFLPSLLALVLARWRTGAEDSTP